MKFTGGPTYTLVGIILAVMVIVTVINACTIVGPPDTHYCISIPALEYCR